MFSAPVAAGCGKASVTEPTFSTTNLFDSKNGFNERYHSTVLRSMINYTPLTLSAGTAATPLRALYLEPLVSGNLCLEAQSVIKCATMVAIEVCSTRVGNESHPRVCL